MVTTRVTNRVQDEVCLEIHVLDEEDNLLALIDSLVIRQLPPTALTDASRQVFESWLYEDRWLELDHQDEPDQVSSFYLTGSNAGELSLFKKRLAELGQKVVPDSKDAEGEADHIVYLSDLNTTSEDLSVSGINANLEATLRPALELLKRLMTASNRHPRLWFITRGAQQLVNENVNPVAAALWGFAQTVMLEYPQLSMSCVDLDPGKNIEESLTQLSLPHLVQLEREDQIALRGDHYYVRRFERLSDATAETGHLTVEPDATYLVTGGLGSLGLQFSHWLVQTHGIQSLVLTSRSAPGKAANEAIDILREMGCEVSVIQADVSKEPDVERLFSLIGEMPELRGLIHCAGVLADGVIATLDWEDFVSSFSAKVSGAWLLHQHSKNLNLDFFVLQSSILSLIGSAGQANYTAANAFSGYTRRLPP